MEGIVLIFVFFRACLKTDFPHWLLVDLVQAIEPLHQILKSLIKFRIHGTNFLFKFFMFAQQIPIASKGSHDLDIDMESSNAIRIGIRNSRMILNEVYFWTDTIKDWKLLLKEDKVKQLVVESWRTLVEVISVCEDTDRGKDLLGIT